MECEQCSSEMVREFKLSSVIGRSGKRKRIRRCIACGWSIYHAEGFKRYICICSGYLNSLYKVEKNIWSGKKTKGRRWQCNRCLRIMKKNKVKED